MANWKGGGLAWLQRLWRSRGVSAAGGSRRTLRVQDALAALEAQVCEAIALPGGEAPGAGIAGSGAASNAHMISSGPAPRNAFGRPLVSEVVHGAGEAVAVATGMTLAGQRSSTFLEGEALAGACGALAGAAARMAPVVVHAAMGSAGHSGYHAALDAGCFQVFAGSGQEAVDLSLLARWLAERALCPGLIASDGDPLESLWLPDAERVRSYLGAPSDDMVCVSEAQRILFGSERRRLLPWFDSHRPVATGVSRASAERAGERELFFREPLADLARRGMEELSSLTGRRLSLLDEHRLDDAEVVLVGQGAVARCARAVADELRRRRGIRVGVVGITWLRPLPTRELARALRGHGRVAVVEAVGDAPASSPLLRALIEAVEPRSAWVSATCAPSGPAPEALAGLCELLQAADPPRRVDLEIHAPVRPSGEFPRREALLQQVANAYPSLSEPQLPRVELGLLQSEGGRSAGLVGYESELPPDAYEELAAAVALDAVGCVHGSATRREPGVLEARVRWARDEFTDPGPRARVSALLVASESLAGLGDLSQALEREGLLLLSTSRSEGQVWRSLPASWQRAVEESELRVYAVGGGLEAAFEVLRGCLDGELEALEEKRRLRRVEWRDRSEWGLGDRPVPDIVSRIPSVRQAHDSLPRFWGEVLQPAQAGAAPGLPDPLRASGVVPAGASALAPDANAAELPSLDAGACTGCGRCWSACPDSAIGVTALGGEALLNAGSRVAGSEGKAADALRRNHKHLAGRVAGRLVKGQAAGFDEAACREAWEWLAGRLELSEEERPEYESAFDDTLECVMGLEPVVTGPFFEEPEGEKKGSGELLVLAFDPRSCLGCGLCVAACPEDALAMESCGDEAREIQRRRWQGWEALPDTRGETLERAAGHAEVGPMAAVLLSRHCAQAQLGAGEGEPASGERLAARWVATLLEELGQRRASALIRHLDGRRAELEEAARAGLAAALSGTDLETLEEALAGVGRGRADLSALGQRLDVMGSRATVDRETVLGAMHLAGELDGIRRRIAEGEDGLGRARFGVLVAGGRAAEWAARFPRHPYYAPLTLAPGAEGAELARGLARGLTNDHVSLIRQLRWAELELESPADRAERREAIEGLRWEDLAVEEKASCTPLLVVCDADRVLDEGFEVLTRLLDSDLPVKVLLLDGRGRLGTGIEPGLVAMAHRRAFVLSTSLAHPDHFARGVADALAWSGPALLHVHAPSPRWHGFAAAATLERARLAVESRAQVLLRYDPGAEGLFGLRASLDGNPGMQEDWGAASFAEWAAGEGRFAEHFEEAGEGESGPSLEEWLELSAEDRKGSLPSIEIDGRRLVVGEAVAAGCAERLALWRTLQELTGARSPFTERIRSVLAEERDADERDRLAALEAQHAAQLAELRGAVEHEGRERLAERLLALSGFGAGASSPAGEEQAERGNGKRA